MLFFRSAIKRRRRGQVIRLKIEAETPPALQTLVRTALSVDAVNTTEVEGILGIADLAQLVDEDRPDLKFDAYSPRFPERIREHGGDCFAAIREKDIVVHHPYESFDVVLAYLRQAAADPGRGGDQADALPHRQELADRARADRRGRGWQVGHRHRRAEGPLRRGAEPHLGRSAGARGRAGGFTASSSGRRTPSSAWSSAAKRAGCAPTCTLAPATITRSPRACTRT